jgi:1-acyl-sn-glycerol-3-phosphate acyltransferase
MSPQRMTVGRFGRDTVRDVRQVARGFRWGRRGLVPASAQVPEQLLPVSGESTFDTSWARGPAATAVRSALRRGVVNPVVSSTVRPLVHGADCLDGLVAPVIFVANHSSHLDTPVLLGALPESWARKTVVTAAADYFFDVWWRAASSALIMNTVPIERQGGPRSTTPGTLLADHWNLLLFPEGTRSEDGQVGTFKLGAAWLAVEYGVPVVPIALRGAYSAMPKGKNWPVRGRQPVSVRFGRPLTPAPGEGPREFGPKIRAAVLSLLWEDADTWWGAQRAAAAGLLGSGAGTPALTRGRAGSADLVPDAAATPPARWRTVWQTSQRPRVPGRARAWR